MTDGPFVMPDLLLTIQKAADFMGVSRRTIYNWIHDGKVRYVRTPGGLIRVIASSLCREVTPSPAPVGFDRAVPLTAA